MIDLSTIKDIYLISGYTDLRNQVDGLIGILKTYKIQIECNVLYIFCSKNKTKIKILEIDGSGVWVYYKRLNSDKFKWPKSRSNMNITRKQLLWFLDGLQVEQKAFQNIKYEH